MHLLNLVAILTLGTMIGVEFAVSAFINPTLGKLGDAAETEATSLFAQLLGRVMPFWYAFCLLLLLAESLLHRQTPGFTLLMAASAIWVAVIAATLLWLVPINNRIARMPSGGYSSELRSLHRRWDWLHRGRVLLLAVALVCLLLALPV